MQFSTTIPIIHNWLGWLMISQFLNTSCTMQTHMAIMWRSMWQKVSVHFFLKTLHWHKTSSDLPLNLNLVLYIHVRIKTNWRWNPVCESTIENLQNMMTSWNENIWRVTGLFLRGFHRSPVNSHYNGQWRGALMFSLICASINVFFFLLIQWKNKPLKQFDNRYDNACIHYDSGTLGHIPNWFIVDISHYVYDHNVHLSRSQEYHNLYCDPIRR